MTQNSHHKELSLRIYLFLSAMFISALLVCNLIANKFITVNLGFKTFVISAGVIPYPLTFLITDILSDVYGKSKTNQVVITGFVCSLFILIVLWIAGSLNAITNSPVSNSAFNTVFQSSWRVIFASMCAYLVAQMIDIRMFHFWKRLTKGKHLWLRNNLSTICSQLVDTSLVISIFFVGQLSLGEIANLIKDGWFYKVLIALVDTAPAYLILYLIRKRLNLKPAEEVSLLEDSKLAQAHKPFG